ncbi:hypothetical protein DFH07DRAFT_1023261 [Mycena maculata]|uniref:Uncharacterized protein n=1 Tax=Mycena maculata TaxID=230809 RepID=A0AAD7NGM3_9AGAR|nr:hypothetical protein DFH07DRAFT_1023261 [Mycena maculata]
MCPLQDYDYSDEDSTDLARNLMRCSMCKNWFYCSICTHPRALPEKRLERTQMELPVGGRPAATVVEINNEFKGEVKRVVAILKEVAAALKDEKKKKLSVPMLAPLLSTLFPPLLHGNPISGSRIEIPSELTERLRYNRATKDSDKFTYRLPIVTACRLLLIDYVSVLDKARRREYVQFFAELTLPTSFCEMYGPKIIGRPADLSPGEYAMLTQVEWAKAQKKEEEVGTEESAGESKENEGM